MVEMTSDCALLAVRYLHDQDAAKSLRSLVQMVAEYRQNNPTPGRRSARKADLNAVASAATRLRKALDRIDPRTQLAGLERGVAARAGHPETATDAGSAPQAGGRLVVSRCDFYSRLADFHRLVKVLDVMAAGFGALADAQEVVPHGGRPERHDALQMGLEWLLALWNRYRPGERPDQSEKSDGFAAFALAVLAVPPVAFDPGTVRGAVIDLLRAREADVSGDDPGRAEPGSVPS